MLVVPEAMEHEDQRMRVPGAGRRLRQVDVELRSVKARHLPRADLDAPVTGAVALRVLIEVGGDRGGCGGRAAGSEAGHHQPRQRQTDREKPSPLPTRPHADGVYPTAGLSTAPPRRSPTRAARRLRGPRPTCRTGESARSCRPAAHTWR